MKVNLRLKSDLSFSLIDIIESSQRRGVLSFFSLFSHSKFDKDTFSDVDSAMFLLEANGRLIHLLCHIKHIERAFVSPRVFVTYYTTGFHIDESFLCFILNEWGSI